MTDVVGDGGQLRTAFAYQLRSYLRTWRFFGLGLFVALIATAILALQLNRGVDLVTANNPDPSDYLSTYLAFVGDAIIIVGAFLGGDALAVDLGGGPGYLMLAQPVRRRTLLAGRFLAAAVASIAVTLVYYVFAVAAVHYFYGTIPPILVASMGEAALFVLAVLAVAFFFSSFFRNPTVSIIASVLILILAFPVLTEIGVFTGREPWYSLNYGSQAVTSVLSTHFVHETVMHLGLGRPGATLDLYSFSPYPWEGAVIMAVYSVVFLGLSYVVYRYREVRG